jgi:RimJ/RimL family protein N-acetyltransferase
MHLACGCCTVRSWQASDLDSLVRHANNFNIWIKLSDRLPHPYTVADGEHWLEQNRQNQPETHFAIECDGEAVGGIGFDIGNDISRCSAQIGYWLGEALWGRGLATAALKCVTQYAVETHGLARVFALAFAGNAASQRVLAKAGYALEGTLKHSAIKNGEILDQAVYAFVPIPAHPLRLKNSALQ